MNMPLPQESNVNIAEAPSGHRAERIAEHAIRSTHRNATQALDQIASVVQQAHDRAVPQLDRLSGRAEDLAHRGIDGARRRSQQLRAKAQDASERTAGQIRDEPFKSVLIAAAVGAALMGVVGLLARSPRTPR